MTREYGHYCGLAHALDLIGARWSLLIVRELLTGPKRFTELEQGLPGVPTNILSTRLRELEADGIIARRLQPRPSNAVVYELTPYGLELEGPVVSLGLWGAKSLGRPGPDAVFSRGSFAIALRAAFHGEEAQGVNLGFAIWLDDHRMHVCVRDGQVSFPPDPPAEPDVTLRAAAEVYADLLGGFDDLDSAIEAGTMQVDGPLRDARRFFEIFRLPTPETAPR